MSELLTEDLLEEIDTAWHADVLTSEMRIADKAIELISPPDEDMDLLRLFIYGILYEKRKESKATTGTDYTKLAEKATKDVQSQIAKLNESKEELEAVLRWFNKQSAQS